MLISTEAAATSLNSYITFKEQLKPILKGGNTAAALNTLAAIAEQSTPYQASSSVKRSKRSKTSFDHHSQSLATNSIHQGQPTHHFLSTRRESFRIANDNHYFNTQAASSHFQQYPTPIGISTQQHSRESSLSSKPKKSKKGQKQSQNITGKENEGEELRLLEFRDKEQHMKNHEQRSTKILKVREVGGCRASADTQAVTVVAPMTSLCSLQNVTNSSLTGHSLAARGSMGVSNPKSSSQVSVLEGGPQNSCYGHNPSQQALQQLLDTHQDLGIMSIYDQSDAKSQAQTNNAENLLREENMMLRMEILKLKKALFMKSQNLPEHLPQTSQVQKQPEITSKSTIKEQQIYEKTQQSDAIYLSKVDERGIRSCDREDGNIKHSLREESSRKQTPLARIGSNGIIEELGSSYTNSEITTTRHIPRYQDNSQNHLPASSTFQSNQIQMMPDTQQLTFNKSDFLARHCMSTVDEQREENNETTTKELDDLEKFLRDQGVSLNANNNNNHLGGSVQGRNFEQPKSGNSSSVYEQKRHYEREIESLRKDLEAIEMEESKIKQKLTEQSTIILEQYTHGNERKGSEGSVQELNRQSIEKMNQFLLKPINVAFDSFLEKRDQHLAGILSPIDHASAHRISDEAPLIILNHHLEQSVIPQSLPSWQPPSFSNSHHHSLRVSPNLKESSSLATVPAPVFVQASFRNQEHAPSQKHQHQQQVVIIPELTLHQVVPTSTTATVKGRARRNRYSQRNILSNLVSGINSEQSERDTQKQGSSRLNTEQIDQMFEDPNAFSQFHRLDTEEQMVLLPSGGQMLKIQKKENCGSPQIDENVDCKKSKNHYENLQNEHEQLLNIKQSIKGVLHKYELSFQQPVIISNESNQTDKEIQGIPRLSTIKEDSPDFGFQIPFTENSDLVNHKSIIVNGKIKTATIRQKSANAFAQKSKLNPSQMTKNSSKSPKRSLKSANQFQYLGQKKKQVKKLSHSKAKKSTSPYNSSSLSSINQMNHILNQAYIDIVKRKQREFLENRQGSNKISNYSISYLQNPTNFLKRDKPKQSKSKIANKTSSQSKENIKYLSNVINKKELGSRNFVDGNYQSLNMKTAVIHNNSSISASHSNQLSGHQQNKKTTSSQQKSPKPVSVTKNSKKSQKPSRSKEKSPLKLEDQQYDLLWSKQVVQKRMNLMRQKEDSLRKKIEDKMNRIEEFTRRKEQEKEERKNRSKSKSPGTNCGATTTMSEFECTPNNQTRITLFERQNGFNTIQPSATQSSAVRSPRQQNVKISQNKTKEKDGVTQNFYSCLASGITTNMVSKQNSDRKNKSVELESESTPATQNRNWDQFDAGINQGGSFTSGQNLQRQHGIDPNITSSTSTVVVTANNCQVIESQATLRNTFKISSLKSSQHHSRSNSVSRIKTTGVNSHHKKQNSLTNPKADQAKTALNRSHTQSLITTPLGYINNSRKIKRDSSPIIIIGDNELMRQFLSNPSKKSSKLRKYIMNAQDQEGSQRLFKLQKIQCNSKVRLLEPIVEDL